MAQGGSGNQSPATLFQARLDTSDGVSNTLTLAQYQGNKVVVSGLMVPVPSSGLTRGVSDNLIDAAGADAGAAGAANTLYYVYISNQKSPFSPSSIRLSATAPTLVNGVKYLGTTGNALNWRFVGWVQLNATPQFESTPTSRLIVNYYNRELVGLFTCPAYVDDGATTVWTATPASAWVPANGGVDNRLQFIANGEDDSIFQAFGVASGSSSDCRIGMAYDGSTSPDVSGLTSNSANQQSMSVQSSKTFSEGFHQVDMVVGVVGTLTFLADLGGFGASPDPAATYLIGRIYA